MNEMIKTLLLSKNEEAIKLGIILHGNIEDDWHQPVIRERAFFLYSSLDQNKVCANYVGDNYFLWLYNFTL